MKYRPVSGSWKTNASLAPGSAVFEPAILTLRIHLTDVSSTRYKSVFMKSLLTLRSPLILKLGSIVIFQAVATALLLWQFMEPVEKAEPVLRTLVLDSQGLILADSAQRLNGNSLSVDHPASGRVVSFELEGQAVSGSWQKIGATESTLLVISTNEAVPPWNISVLPTLVTGLVCILAFSLALLWIPLTRLSRSLHDYADLTGTIAEGCAAGGWPKAGSAELHRLGQRLRDLADRFHRQNKALYDSEARLQTTFNSIGDAVILTDTEGRVTRINPTAEQLTGWLEEEAKDQPLQSIFRIIDSATRQQVESPVEKVLASGQKVGLASNTLLVSRNGREMQIADSGTPIRNIDGSIAGVVLVFRDVTMDFAQEQRIREKEQQFRELVSNVPGVLYQYTAPSPNTIEKQSTITTVIREKCLEILGIDPQPAAYFDEFIGCLPEDNRPGFIDSIKQAVEKNENWRYEGRFVKPDGEVIWIEAQSAPRNVGENTVFYGLITDITQRKKMESTLRFFQFIFDKADIAIFVLGENGEFLHVNEQVSRYLGYSLDELHQMCVFDIDTMLTREDWPGFMQNLRSHGVQIIETMNRRKDGQVIPVQVIDNVMTFEGEEFHVAFVQDISERKQMEQALKTNQERLEMALRSANEGIWNRNLNPDTIYFDARYYTIAGYQPDEFPATFEAWEERVYPDDLGRIKSDINQYVAGEQETIDLEYRFQRKDGSYMWVHDKGRIVSRDADGRPLRLSGTRADITLRKQLEESLRLTQFIFDEAPIGVWRMGKSGEILDVNAQGCASLGYSREELCRMSVFDFAPGYDQEDWAYASDQLQKVATVTIEAQHQRRNGNIFPVQVIAKLMRFEGQEYQVAFVQEITERKQNEEELRRLRNYLNNIIDSMPSTLIGVDNHGHVTQWNKTAELDSGINADAARGRSITELLPWMSTATETIRQSIRTRDVIHQQATSRPRNGDTCYEDVTVYPLVTNGVEGAVIRIDDVTEKIRLQEMMIQSEKMLSVGGLAAGMAHEINNPLAGILQTANVLSNRLADKLDNPASLKAAEEAGTSPEAIAAFMRERGILRMLDAIKDSGRRVAEIVDNMLSFARKSNATVSSHSLNELLDKTLKLAMADYDLKKEFDFKQIEIVREYDDELPQIPCEGAKIQQVLLNLLSNGAQAMSQQPDRFSRFTLRTYVEQQQVCLEVEDNGPGMDEATRKRVFEPFFTTKPVGVGTGLGLSVSYFIITENHGGQMSVQSSPGHGSRFKVCLPMQRETSA